MEGPVYLFPGGRNPLKPSLYMNAYMQISPFVIVCVVASYILVVWLARDISYKTDNFMEIKLGLTTTLKGVTLYT